jgi:hypothetical protein
VRLALTPRRRGRIELAGLSLARTDPLGLVRGLARVRSRRTSSRCRAATACRPSRSRGGASTSPAA